MQKYTLTIKRNSNPTQCFKEHLEEALNILQKREKTLVVLDLAYEVDSTNYLHIHSTILLRKSPYYQHFKIPGYHIYLKKLQTDEDLKVWSAYIHKQSSNQIEQEALLKKHIITQKVKD